MIITIKPLIGVNDIELGMSRDVIRSKLSATPETFKKAFWSTTDSDLYEKYGLAFHYSDSLVLTEIDIVPENQVILLGAETWKLDFEQILNLIKSNGYEVEADDFGSVIINELGLVIGEENNLIDGWCLYRGRYQDLCKLEMEKAKEYYAENTV